MVAAASLPVQMSVQAKHKIHYAVQLIFRLRLRSGRGVGVGWGGGTTGYISTRGVLKQLLQGNSKLICSEQCQISAVLSLALLIGSIMLLSLLLLLLLHRCLSCFTRVRVTDWALIMRYSAKNR